MCGLACFGFQADSVPPSKQETHFVDADHCLGEPDLLPFQPAQSEPDLDTKGGNLERITLHIPLNETGSAGLGVSVKGKTETLESNSRDLGIFVKTVLQGGAAYKVWTNPLIQNNVIYQHR